MADSLIPDATKVAAKRGFIRTAAQSLSGAAVLGGGLTLAFTSNALLAIAVAIASAVVDAVVTGAQSYFSIISKGIPVDYTATSKEP